QLERHAIQAITIVGGLASNRGAIIYSGQVGERVTSTGQGLDDPLNALARIVSICRGVTSNDRVGATANIRPELKALITRDVASVSVTPTQTNALRHAIRHVLQIHMWDGRRDFRTDDGEHWRSRRITGR